MSPQAVKAQSAARENRSARGMSMASGLRIVFNQALFRVAIRRSAEGEEWITPHVHHYPHWAEL